MPRADKNEPLYLIGVAARLCEVHPQTLRMYERLGLVQPARVGTKNRMYSDADIERLHQIQRLTQDLGVNLAGVEVILDLLDKMQRIQEQMDTEIARMQEIMEEQFRRMAK